MAQDVVMPQMGESIAEGTITTWLKNVGDTVERDEALFEMSTDKVDAEIPSPVEGTLLEIKVEAGATVEVGTVVAVMVPPAKRWLHRAIPLQHLRLRRLKLRLRRLLQLQRLLQMLRKRPKSVDG